MGTAEMELVVRARVTGEGVLGWIAALNRWEVVYWTEPPEQLPHWRTAGRDVRHQPSSFAPLPDAPDLSARTVPCYVGVAA